MVSPNLRSAANAETRPAKRKSHEFSDTDVTPESESESEGVSEYEDGHSSLRPRRKTAATSIAAKVVKRRRAAAGRSKLMAQRRVSPTETVTPPPTTTMSSSPEGSEGSEGKGAEEGYEDEDSTSSGSEPALVLKWSDIPYPGLPQPGYAFSYASGPICFLKVPSDASKSLSAHWHPPQNYVAYVIYSLHPSPYTDNKVQGLEMVNELAANGFIDNYDEDEDEDDDDCWISEDRVDTMRALTFHKGNVAVSVPKLGDMTAFRGYTATSRVDDTDRKMISEMLQGVMHDRAFVAKSPSASLSASPESAARCSDESRLRGTTLTASEEEEEEEEEEADDEMEDEEGGEEEEEGSSSSTDGAKNLSLETSGLIKSIKVHWRQSKWVVDNIHSIRRRRRSTRHHQQANTRVAFRTDSTSSSSPSSSSTESLHSNDSDNSNFKAVIIHSNKSERLQGLNLLERLIAARLGGRKNDFMRDVVVCKEVVDGDDDDDDNGAEFWLVWHKKEVVVAFPGQEGDEAFVEAVEGMERVWT